MRHAGFTTVMMVAACIVLYCVVVLHCKCMSQDFGKALVALCENLYGEGKGELFVYSQIPLCVCVCVCAPSKSFYHQISASCVSC